MIKKSFSFITDKIAIGSCHSAKGLERIKENGCTAVLNVAIDVDISYFGHARSWGRFDLEYHKVGLYDNDKNNESMLMAAVYVLEQLLDRGHTVLLHCRVGASRSVTVCALHLARKHKMTFKDAVKEIANHRPQAKPVPGITKLANSLMCQEFFHQG